MFIIRPIQFEDYPMLYTIAEESGHGFTSLPTNEHLLQQKIEQSQQAFAKPVSEPGSESYLFVLEDLSTNTVVGTSGIHAAVGLDDAFYHYHLGQVTHSSPKLNIYKTVDILTLCNDYTGHSEICSLFLRDSARRHNNGKLLSRVRFPFMAEHSTRFSSRIFAEMRGISNKQGTSPFWLWLQEHFFSIDFPTADYLTGIGDKVFIAELMPKYPIYVNLLSKEAQKVIGQVHEKTRPALKMLQDEGFHYRRYVDIFDAGPTMEAELNQVRSARKSFKVSVEIGPIPSEDTPLKPYIVCNDKLAEFRATLVNLPETLAQEVVRLPIQVADNLLLNTDDQVRIVALTG